MFFYLHRSDLQQIKSLAARLQNNTQCEFTKLSRKNPGHSRKKKQPLPIIQITASVKSLSQEKMSLSICINNYFWWARLTSAKMFFNKYNHVLVAINICHENTAWWKCWGLRDITLEHLSLLFNVSATNTILKKQK